MGISLESAVLGRNEKVDSHCRIHGHDLGAQER
jgi:hypothetical protein